MTKGGSNKPNALGRLIFGEKRKQHASPSRHRSTTRNTHEIPPVSSSGENRHKHPINIHDWAVWRMHLNEQMENGSGDPIDIKQMRQFLQSNAFYQQHSRDPSTGRYNGVRLLFSIPHAKIKPELVQPVQEISNANSNVKDMLQSEQQDDQSNIDDRALTSVHTAPTKPAMITDKTINQLLPKNLIGNTAGFFPGNEQTISTDPTRTHRSMRASYSAADRVHSTLQKAVKDGNVLEKIKAFEMQAAAAAQSDSTPKLGRDTGVHNVIHNRIQPITSSISSTAQRTLSPTRSHPIQHPISSPQLMHHDLSSASQQLQQQQQQYIRTHRSRYAHPTQQQQQQQQQHHRDGSHLRSMMGRESRKGAHVLEPAHGDIILKRRTPSQKTMNDEDYSMTIKSSMALSPSQGHHHHRHHHSHYHRSSVSRSRHRQEGGHDRRSSSHHDHHTHKKNHPKQKETAKATATTTTTSKTQASSSSNKTSSRRGWLKGRKETSNAETTETSKQDSTTTKSKKKNKNKKNNDKDKSDSTKKATPPDPKDKSLTTAENNRVYGVPNTTCNEQTKSEAISSVQPSSQIDEENDTDYEDKNTEFKKLETPLEEEEEGEEEEEEHHHQHQEKIVLIKSVEKRTNQTKPHQKLPSVEGEIPSKIEDETRFSRPTDDHAHRSDFNDDDDEYKSEGDVFLEEIPPQQHASNAIERQDSVDEISSDRRWQWSKEIGGLIEKAVHKKKQQPITILTRKNKVNIEEDQQVIYEVPQAEQNSSLSLKKVTSFDDDKQSTSDTQISKQLLHSIMNTKKKDSTNLDKMKRDEFFEHGPHTNPEETIVNITSSA